MPIILAIEPDRWQAAHLSAIVKNRVGADLILADTTEGALDAIGNRVPDLVLVPALLSPQDDAALAAALRVIAAAAHVRTLTIPVLASSVAEAPRRGLLAKWRRGRAGSPAPDGCDPAVFAEQIAAYLREAAAERAEQHSVADVADMTDLAADAAETSAIVEPMRLPQTEWLEEAETTPEPLAAAEVAETFAIVEPMPPPQTPWLEDEETAAEALVAADPLVAAEPLAAAAPDEECDNEEDIDLSLELIELSEEEPSDEVQELFAGEPVGVYTMSVEDIDLEMMPAAEEIVLEAMPVVEAIPVVDPMPVFEAMPVVDAVVAEPMPPVEDPFVVEFFVGYEEPAVAEMQAEDAEPDPVDAESWVSMYLTPGRMWPALEGMPAESPLLLDEFAALLEAEPVPPAPAKSERTEWTALVASLRQDIERRRGETQQPEKPKRRVKKAKPVQDEWGFFDPEQCGFAALLAKLEEITDGTDEPDVRQPS
jgi:hypothetical protein